MIGKSIYKLLQPIVDAIDKTIIISNIIDNGDDTYTLESCDTAYATVGFTITINSVDYKIISIVPNESITISGASLPVTKLVTLYAPKFYHGTVIATNLELNNKTLSWEKFPMIWLHEVVSEIVDLSELQQTTKKVSCEFYIMVDANHTQWTNDNQYELAIQPMRNLLERFVKSIQKSKIVNEPELDSMTISDRAKWGVYIGEKGNTTKIFADNLSGVKLEIEIPFIIDCEC